MKQYVVVVPVVSLIPVLIYESNRCDKLSVETKKVLAQIDPSLLSSSGLLPPLQ